MSHLAEMFSGLALAGLCANPHHQAGEHPNTGSTVAADRAFALGNALAAKFERDEERSPYTGPAPDPRSFEERVRLVVAEMLEESAPRPAPVEEAAPADAEKPAKKAR